MYTNIQEQEEIDYQMGAASELQNAYAWSRMNRRGDDPQINRELAAGRFIVVEEGLEFCPSTDATMGTRKFLASSHPTRQEAEAALASLPGGDDEHWTYILPRPAAPPPPACEPLADGDIPF